jgi:hypothetical protein
MPVIAKKIGRPIPTGPPRQRKLFCDAPCCLGAADGLCLLLRQFLRPSDDPQLSFAAELSLRECLNNAIQYGKKHAPDTRIRLRVVAGGDVVSLFVCHDGQDFDWRRSLGLSRIDRVGSVAIIGAYAKQIRFNRKGKEIRLDIARTHVRSMSR